MATLIWALLLSSYLVYGQQISSSSATCSFNYSHGVITSNCPNTTRLVLQPHWTSPPAVTTFSKVNDLSEPTVEHVQTFLGLTPPFVAAGKGVSEQCRKDSELYIKELKDVRLWAIKMYDAGAKLSSGLLNGNAVLLGDYDQCLAVRRAVQNYDDSTTAPIAGKYCIATVYVDPHKTSGTSAGSTVVLRSRKRDTLHSVVDMMQSHNAMRNDYEDDMRFLPTFSPISWALCVPDSCTEADLEASLGTLLRPYNLTSGLDLKPVVQPGNCITTETETRVSIGFLVTLAFFGGTIFLAIYGLHHEKAHTAPDGQLLPSATKGTWRQVCMAMSFRRNWRLLIDTSGHQDELSCVHGLRAIASFFIYVIHRSVFAMFYPFTNRTQVAEFLEGDWTMLFRAFWNWVDSFVVLSGLLTCYYALKKLQHGRGFNIPRMYLQRWIKFTPMVFVMAISVGYLIPMQVDAPQRIRIIQHYVDKCDFKGILGVITYTNVLLGFENMCYPPSHQLATDMHMYLLAPFIVLAMWRWPRMTPIAILSTLTILAAYKYHVVLNEGLGSFLYYGVSTKQISMAADNIYINAIHRLTPYLSGMALAFVLRTRDPNSKLSRVEQAAGSAIAVACALYSFYGVAHAARRDYQFDVNESAAFAVVQPLFWSFALCWLIFCCATGQAPAWLRRFLTWRGFTIYSRLSYAVYITQLYIIAVNVGQTRTPEYFRLTKMVDLNEILTVAACSLLGTLLFLLPLGDLWAVATKTYKPPVYAPKTAASVDTPSNSNGKATVCQE